MHTLKTFSINLQKYPSHFFISSFLFHLDSDRTSAARVHAGPKQVWEEKTGDLQNMFPDTGNGIAVAYDVRGVPITSREVRGQFRHLNYKKCYCFDQCVF